MEWLLIGIPIGFAVGWLLAGRIQSRRAEALSLELTEKQRELDLLQARQQMQEQLHAEQEARLEKQRKQFEDVFKALSADALQRNSTQFIELATQTLGKFQEGAKGDLEQRRQAIEELVKPIRDSLKQVDAKMQEVEKAREGAYTGLQEQVRQLLVSQNQLQGETKNLVHALKTPSVRGRWGELQLERTVEFAGMTEHVEFIKQVHAVGDDGVIRPDLIVRLPGSKQIVVDAKAPLDAYLKALECGERDKEQSYLEQHALQIRQHIKALASKRYWRQFDPSPEFVVIFLPGEVFFSAALEKDPGLIEFGSAENVLLATPTTLIALLKAAAYGWRQEAVAERAREITQLGRELYDRLVTQSEHFTDVGKALKRSVDAYNKSLRSLESRVLVTARKFEALTDDRKKTLPELEQISDLPIESDSPGG
jgi:DNA recombination protein RmuC